MSTLPKQTSNSKALTSKAAPLWPLWFLLLAAPATVLFTALQLPLLNKWPLYGLVLWTMALFCYAHRMVYLSYCQIWCMAFRPLSLLIARLPACHL